MDLELDRLQQVVEKLHFDGNGVPLHSLGAADSTLRSRHITILHDTFRTLSVTSTSKPFLRQDRLVNLISQILVLDLELSTKSSDAFSAYISDLAWLVAAKAAVQTLGSVMNIFLDQTLILNDEVSYWDEILESFWYSNLYTVQTSPLRFWHRTKEVYSNWNDSLSRSRSPNSSVSSRWVQFYNLVQQSIQRQSTCCLHTRVLSMFSIPRLEVRRNRKLLKAFKEVHASSIGLLMEKCLTFKMDDDISNQNTYSPISKEWRSTIFRSAILMETGLRNASTCETSVTHFEERIFATVEREAGTIYNQLDAQTSIRQSMSIMNRLICILQEFLPNYITLSTGFIGKHGRPPRLVRYWLPFSVALFSASTSLKVLANRRAELVGWTLDLASTFVDFWGNWVLEPIQKLIRTIRHDENSEIAIMSKNSLEADRASLERMVVEFVLDRPDLNQSHSDIEAIINKVKEGDLTPVLKAYERDLRAPLVGTVRGDLIRALLIQIQKTKVDVEIAISGIDALLKSQELVFGYVQSLLNRAYKLTSCSFVGLTPGILVSYAAFMWLWGLFDSRKGLRLGRKHDELRRALRYDITKLQILFLSLLYPEMLTEF